MSWYDHRLPYRDWLRLDAINQIADKASRQNALRITGSFHDLQADIGKQLGHVESSLSSSLGKISRDIYQGFDRLSGQLDDISASIDQFHADFNWWAREQSEHLTDIKEILKNIENVLRQKNRVEAFEFFEYSRDFKRHGKYEKSLSNILIAIYGDGDRVRGYELEWRFWEHLGTIYFGNSENSGEIVDPKKAEDAFLTGSELAQRDGAPAGSARCLLGAAMAAYIFNDKERAILHAEKALKLAPNSAEALWQLGRHYWSCGKDANAQQCFARALWLDYRYAKRFVDDPIFLDLKRLSHICSNIIKDMVQKSSISSNLNRLTRCLDLLKFENAAVLQAARNSLETIKAHRDKENIVNVAFACTAGNSVLEGEIGNIRSFIENQKSDEERKAFKAKEEKSGDFMVILVLAVVGIYIGMYLAGFIHMAGGDLARCDRRASCSNFERAFIVVMSAVLSIFTPLFTWSSIGTEQLQSKVILGATLGALGGASIGFYKFRSTAEKEDTASLRKRTFESALAALK